MTDCGRITMSPRDDIVAGSTVTLTFTYTVGESGMKSGGQLRIATPNDAWEWPEVPLHRYFQKGHERGGYESQMAPSSKLVAGSGEKIVAETIELLKGLHR